MKSKMAANDYIRHRTIERETAVAMKIFDQLSTYIYMCMLIISRMIYILKKRKKLFALQIEFLPIYDKNSICSW